jgi:hypothetical protein
LDGLLLTVHGRFWLHLGPLLVAGDRYVEQL